MSQEPSDHSGNAQNVIIKFYCVVIAFSDLLVRGACIVSEIKDHSLLQPQTQNE